MSHRTTMPSLLLPGLLLTTTMLVITWLSFAFDPLPSEFKPVPVSHSQRPILLVVGLFGLCGLIWLWAIKRAERKTTGNYSLAILVTLLTRLILLPGLPIQEVDLYRYLWDGAVLNAGLSPYQYAPEQVVWNHHTSSVELNAQNADVKQDQQRLTALFISRPALVQIHQAVHYPHLVTIYPPVSQAVFGLSVLSTPCKASRWTTVSILKSWLLLFDLLICGLIGWMLKKAKLPWHWGLLYWWNPLILKEIANSGHLDVIAACFMLAGLACLMRSMHSPVRSLAGCLILLSLGVGAKLFPMLLIPLVSVFVARKHGGRCALVCLGTGALLCTLFILPMSSWSSSVSTGPSASHSLTTFLTRWEMNDLLFQFVLENLRPQQLLTTAQPWFLIMPDSWRMGMMTHLAYMTRKPMAELLFPTARVITLCIWLLILLVCTVRVWRASDKQRHAVLLEQSFIVLIWFWLLSPTQNPWYLIGPFVLLPWARTNSWRWLSLVCFAYYLRFWLMYQWPEGNVLSTGYSAGDFFFHIIVWLEFGPLLLMILLSKFKSRRPDYF